MNYSGIALLIFQIEPMRYKKYKMLVYISLLSVLGIPNKSSALKFRQYNDIFNAKTQDCTVGYTMDVDSIANFSISIQGKQNLVTIKTDSLTIQTAKSFINKPKDSNTIEINGRRNSVSVTQDTKGKIEVKQSGNNNHINISQSNHQP